METKKPYTATGNSQQNDRDSSITSRLMSSEAPLSLPPPSDCSSLHLSHNTHHHHHYVHLGIEMASKVLFRKNDVDFGLMNLGDCPTQDPAFAKESRKLKEEILDHKRKSEEMMPKKLFDEELRKSQLANSLVSSKSQVGNEPTASELLSKATPQHSSYNSFTSIIAMVYKGKVYLAVEDDYGYGGSFY